MLRGMIADDFAHDPKASELAAWLRLSLATSSVPARKLLAAIGSPTAIFERTAPELGAIVGPQTARDVLAMPPTLAALLAATKAWLEQSPHHQGEGKVCRAILTLDDPGYPRSLLHIPDPPLMLYALGMSPMWTNGAPFSLVPERSNALAIVGSRNASPQGLELARKFAQHFSDNGVVVVSGLALGVDGAAHEGALAGASPTVAVIGTGLDRVYPKRHHDLAHRIAHQGVILSEYHLGTPALAPNFPRRNRLISGLALGTLVVEAAIESGSLITARMAAEQGKDVFAIPGSVHSPHAKGCHKLIKQGAKLVETADDVMSELQLDLGLMVAGHDEAPLETAVQADEFHPTQVAERESTFDQTQQFWHSNRLSMEAPETMSNPLHTDILMAMGYDPLDVNSLAARSALDMSTLLAHLLELELMGRVARMPGGRYQQVGYG